MKPVLGSAVSCGTCLPGKAVELDEQFFPVSGRKFGDVLTTSTPRATKFPAAHRNRLSPPVRVPARRGLGKHLLGSVTINFTGNGGFNPKLDMRYFDIDNRSATGRRTGRADEPRKAPRPSFIIISFSLDRREGCAKMSTQAQ